MKQIFYHLLRLINNGRRSTKKENLRLLAERNENLQTSFIFREATNDDVPALSKLHVLSWNDTYPYVRNPPSVELRQKQWTDYFRKPSPDSFVLLIESGAGKLVGFARGVKQDDNRGDLNKIYLLREYQRLGLGKKLICIVASRFKAMGLTSMQVLAEAVNPSCWFYEKMGGRKLNNKDGTVNHGNYWWPDLDELTKICS